MVTFSPLGLFCSLIVCSKIIGSAVQLLIASLGEGEGITTSLLLMLNISIQDPDFRPIFRKIPGKVPHGFDRQ